MNCSIFDKDFATSIKNHLQCTKRVLQCNKNLNVQLQIQQACLRIYWAWFRPISRPNLIEGRPNYVFPNRLHLRPLSTPTPLLTTTFLSKGILSPPHLASSLLSVVSFINVNAEKQFYFSNFQEPKWSYIQRKRLLLWWYLWLCVVSLFYGCVDDFFRNLSSKIGSLYSWSLFSSMNCSLIGLAFVAIEVFDG